MKNYYLILGISPQANAEGVRRAFREKAKKYHPDKTGQDGTSFFQDITEAYEVLSDPGRRSEYNRKFDETEHRPSPSRTSRAGSETESASADPFAEPLRTASPSAADPLQGAFFGRGSRGFPHMELEVILSPEEAREGFSTTLDLPLSKPCPDCRGESSARFFSCERCGGEGAFTLNHRVRLTFPPEIRHGSRADIPLRSETGYGLLLRLHFRIHTF